jgi:hypothetical protein
MKHIHKNTGLEFDVSRLIDFDGRTHDMCVITKWDVENNFEENPILIDYYFGDYDRELTDDCIDEYYRKQIGLQDGLKFLEGEYLINCVDGDFMEPDQKKSLENSIEVLKQII